MGGHLSVRKEIMPNSHNTERHDQRKNYEQTSDMERVYATQRGTRSKNQSRNEDTRRLQDEINHHRTS